MATIPANPDTSSDFPSGGIIMWSGTIALIPSGWNLCDGNNGTPNLTNMFVIGASIDGTGDDGVTNYGVGDSGGEREHQLTEAELATHTHTSSSDSAGTPSGSVTVNSASAVTGGFNFAATTSPAWSEVALDPQSSKFARTITSGSSIDSTDHTHSASFSGSAMSSHGHTINSTGSDTAHENRPPFYAMAYIMKA